jgi:hypothetical protein
LVSDGSRATSPKAAFAPIRNTNQSSPPRNLDGKPIKTNSIPVIENQQIELFPVLFATKKFSMSLTISLTNPSQFAVLSTWKRTRQPADAFEGCRYLNF